MDGIDKAGRSPVGLFSRKSFSQRPHGDFLSDTVAVSKVGVPPQTFTNYLLTKSPLTVSCFRGISGMLFLCQVYRSNRTIVEMS
jgi:hypothetical protein